MANNVSYINQLRILCVSRIRAEFAAVERTTLVLADAQPNQPLPYVDIGGSLGNDLPIDGETLELTINCYSDAEGPHEIEEIQRLIRKALHGYNGSVQAEPGLTIDFVNLRQTFADRFVDVTDETWQGSQRFVALVCESNT